jgi:hypothetical protein
MRMESIFKKTPVPNAPPTVYERIGPEITHLKKSSSSRYGADNRSEITRWPALIIFCSLLTLYIMDPFLYAWHKYEAIQVYLYLHNYESGPATDDLVAARLFSPDEIRSLNKRSGDLQDSFASAQAAKDKAAAIVSYINSLRDLHAGRYDKLDHIGKLRYVLFVRNGVYLPDEWDFLNPSVE